MNENRKLVANRIIIYAANFVYTGVYTMIATQRSLLSDVFNWLSYIKASYY